MFILADIDHDSYMSIHPIFISILIFIGLKFNNILCSLNFNNLKLNQGISN